MSNSDMVVDVWIDSQEEQKGILGIKGNELVISLDSGVVITRSNATNVLYSPVNESSIPQSRIIFNPIPAAKKWEVTRTGLKIILD